MLFLRLVNLKSNMAAAAEAWNTLRTRRGLIFEMTRRDIADRYAGQVLGIGWAIATPLLTMGTYVFAFAFLFRGRLGPHDNGMGYIAYVLCGLVCWMAISECLSRSATAVTGNANLVKQIVFPNEILPLKVALATLPSLFIGLIVTAIASAFSGGLTLVGCFVLLPLAVCFYVLLLSGIGFMLAALGVFVRDIKDMVAFFTGIGMFLHPILYPPASTPGWLKPLFMLSPFSHMIWCFRDAMLGFDPAHAWSWLIYPLVSILFFVIGWRLFRMMRPLFGNAL